MWQLLTSTGAKSAWIYRMPFSRSQTAPLAITKLPPLGVEVSVGVGSDSIGPRHSQTPSNLLTTRHVTVGDVESLLAEVEAEVLVLYLPTGSAAAAAMYAEAAVNARVALVNCTFQNSSPPTNTGQIALKRQVSPCWVTTSVVSLELPAFTDPCWNCASKLLRRLTEHTS